MVQCRNCQTSLDGSFCPNCGQKNIDLERPMSALIGDILKETFDLDGRASRTIRALILQPGFLTSEFLAGRRKAFTPPLRLYLVFSVSFFVLIAWLAGQGVLLAPGESVETDGAIQAQFMANELPRLMFVLLPIFAVLLKIVFFRRLYFDHLIFSLHLHSVAFVVLALMFPIEQLADVHWPLMVAQAVLLAAFMLYFVVALRVVYQSNWFVLLLKSVAILFGYMIVVSIAIEMTSNFLILGD
jgi:hypothetical protein